MKKVDILTSRWFTISTQIGGMNMVDISTVKWFTISTQIGGINRVGISTLKVFWKRWNTTPLLAKNTQQWK